jgi:MFS family permease
MENQPVNPAPPPPAAAFPPGVHDAWRFQAFNFLAVQIPFSGPMILYAKTLNASATVLGVIAGMMPLLVVLQLPAVSLIRRAGYRRFVMTGWGLRPLIILGLALVPLAGGAASPATQLALVLALLFALNVANSISGCGWLPWMASLIPENLLGKYLTGDSLVANFSSFITILLAAGCLGADPQPWQFAALFAFSGLMGLVSLIFLRRIPDAAVPEQGAASSEPVPWLEILRHRPFKKLLWVALAWGISLGGLGAFTVAFLKAEAGLSAGKILLITTVSFLGGLASLTLLGHRLDHVGSKPVLGFALGMWVCILGGWMAMAGGVLPASLTPLCLLQFFMGFSAALIFIASNRLVITLAPPLGRAHFLAVFSVVFNVTMGLAPVAWGLLIDAVGDWRGRWLGLEWNRFSIFFAAAAATFVWAFALSRRLDEPKAAPLETLLSRLLIQSPQRLWLRFWSRIGF